MKTTKLAAMAALAAAVTPAAAQERREMHAQVMERLDRLERQAQASEDRGEIENLFSRYMYLHNAFQDEQIIPLWAREGTPDIAAEYSNLGRYTTYDSIMEYHRNRPNPTGKLIFHELSTPVIEIAGDGQTAKGMWIMTGLESGLTRPEFAEHMPEWMHVPEIMVDGERVWMHEVYAKYGIDFILQDGEWRIWHFRCFEVARSPFGMGWIPWAAQAEHGGFNSDLMYIGDDGQPVFMPQPDAPAQTEANPYRIDGGQTLDARLPEPYYTFSETFSY
jgi:hypothetical protein